MFYLNEAFARLTAHAKGGGVRRNQFGMLGFESLEAVHQLVVFGVRNLGLVQDVVKMFVAAQVGLQLFDLARGIFHWALIYNLTRKRENRPITGYKNAVLIYNPRAGKFGRAGRASLDRAIEILKRDGIDVTVVPTTGPRTASALARNCAQKGADLVIAAGGDGTINETAEGLIHTHVPLAILPGGTANVLSMEMKLGRNLERVAHRFGELQPRRIPVGHLICGGGTVSRHFLLMAGIGLDAHIVYRVNAAIKARAGKFAYWLAGWSLLGKSLAQMEAEVDGRRFGCSFALVSKVRNYGGDFEIAQSVRVFDDQFEVVLFEGRNTFPYVKYFLSMALRRLEGTGGVTILRSCRISLPRPADERVFVQIDGEFAGHLPAEITLVPDALTLLVPPEYGD